MDGATTVTRPGQRALAELDGTGVMLREAVAVLMVIGLLAAACSGTETAQLDRADLIAAVDAHAETPPARFEMTIDYDFDSGGENYSLMTVGEVDTRTGSSRSTLDLTAALAAAGGDEEAPDVDREIETILVGDDLFITGRAFWPLAGDAEYVRVDTTRLTDGVGFEALFEQPAPTADGPTDALEQLRVLDGFEVVGSEDIGESPPVSTTRVRGTILMGDALDELTDEQQDGLRQLYGVSSWDALRDLVVPIDAFVDGDERLRRMVQRFDIATMFPATSDDSPILDDEVPEGTFTLTIDFDGFGDEVEIEAPEGAVDVTDEVLEQLDETQEPGAELPADDDVAASDDLGPLTHDQNFYGAAGTCVQLPEALPVGCDELHSMEVIADSVDLGDGDYPGEREVHRQADSRCLEVLAELDPEGDFISFPSQPTRRAWESGRRFAVCLASPISDDPVTGSLVAGTAG